MPPLTRANRSALCCTGLAYGISCTWPVPTQLHRRASHTPCKLKSILVLPQTDCYPAACAGCRCAKTTVVRTTTTSGAEERDNRHVGCPGLAADAFWKAVAAHEFGTPGGRHPSCYCHRRKHWLHVQCASELCPTRAVPNACSAAVTRWSCETQTPATWSAPSLLA